MIRRPRFYFFMLAMALIFLLSACAQKPSLPYPSLQPNPEDVRAKEVTTIVEQLVKKQVMVTQVGETFDILIPSDKLFFIYSANLKNGYAASVLGAISRLMTLLRSNSAKVSAYTNWENSPQVDYALSERQAQVVIDYLWTKKIDSRLLYAKGYGTKFPIINNPKAYNKALNRRVEIHFQYLPLALGR